MSVFFGSGVSRKRSNYPDAVKEESFGPDEFLELFV
jgi:hypothetical protein